MEAREINLYLTKAAYFDDDTMDAKHEVSIVGAYSYSDAVKQLEEYFCEDLLYIEHVEAFENISRLDDIVEATDGLWED